VGAAPAAAQVSAAPQQLLEFGAPGSGTGALAARPGHVAVDADGNVWVADTGNDRVVKYDYNGAFVAEVRSAGPSLGGAFVDPEGVGTDAAGSVYVADTGRNRVVKLTSDGTPVSVIAPPPGSTDPLTGPTGIAVDGSGRLLVVAGASISRFAANGSRLPGIAVTASYGVAVDRDGALWVGGVGELRKLRPDGTEERRTEETFGGAGSDVTGIATTPDGVVHVGTYVGGDLSRFDASATYLGSYPPGRNTWPITGVAADCRGNVYVVHADRENPDRWRVGKFGDPAAPPPPCGPRPLPAGTIDTQINDIEVTQGVQRERTFTPSRLDTGALRVPAYDDAAFYGPTVPLSENRATVVRVYATLRGGPAGGLGNVPATLQVTQRLGGRTVRHDAILPVAQPSVLRVGSTTVDPALRANPAGAYTFVLPPAWARGTVSLAAQVNPANQGCAQACQARSRFRLDNVAFRRTATATVFPLALTVKPPNLPPIAAGPLPDMPGVGRLTHPGPAFDMARVLTPTPINLLPWLGRIEVGDLVRATSFVEESCFLGIELDLLCAKENKEANREIRQGQVMERIERWVDDNNVGDNVVTMGLISDVHPDLPGAMLRELFDDETVFGYAAVHRPITAVAHELQHALGRPHAGTDPSCYPDAKQLGVGWPKDERGLLQGIGLDPRPGSGGGRGPFALLSPGANAGPAEWYDLMSYCNAKDKADEWVSPRGWTELVNFHPPRSAVASRQGVQARAAQGGPVLRVVATADTAGGLTLSGLSPGAGPAEPGDPASPFVLETRDAAGRTTRAATRMHAEALPDGGGIMLSGDVPAAGAAMVVVRREGASVAVRRVRSAAAPTVRLLAPRARGAAPLVRWRASDADGDRLVARVEYSANAGRTWRTVYLGASSGAARLAGTQLAPSRRARVRVRVDDGFNEAVATSPVFTVVPAAPEARIADPDGPLRVRPGAPVILRAEASAGGQRLTGRALRWQAGRRTLGTGETITIPALAAGRHVVRLVATANGRSTIRTVTLTAPAVRAQFLALSAPGRVRPRARSARVRVASTVAATLSAGSRRVGTVGPRARTLTVRIRPGSGPVQLGLALRTPAGITRATLTIPRG
jgi:hypothetical protein